MLGLYKVQFDPLANKALLPLIFFSKVLRNSDQHEIIRECGLVWIGFFFFFFFQFQIFWFSK
jgi:hypothetical protein